MEILVKKMAGNFFQKSLNWKEKITKFIENTDDEWTSNERFFFVVKKLITFKKFISKFIEIKNIINFKSYKIWKTLTEF